MSFISPQLREFLTNPNSSMDIKGHTLEYQSFGERSEIRFVKSDTPSATIPQVRNNIMEHLIQIVWQNQSNRTVLLTLRGRIRQLDHLILEPYNKTISAWRRVFSMQSPEVPLLMDQERKSDMDHWITKFLADIEKQERAACASLCTETKLTDSERDMSTELVESQGDDSNKT